MVPYPVPTLLIGTGGYASFYVRNILQTDQTDVRLAGTVDPTTDGIPDSDVPHWGSLADFFNDASADLAIISSPPMFHEQQIRECLEAGCHVLCEKPLFPNPGPVESVAGLRDRVARAVGVGFQWSFTSTILDLKADILAGTFGAPLHARGLVLWPRSFAYHQRNSWAGRIDDDRGNPINDSVLFNATAHHFHNLTFLLGPQTDRGARVRNLHAETYRAYDIENFDTVALRGETDTGIPLAYYASHAGDINHSPIFEIAFENATVGMDEGEHGWEIVANFADGTSAVRGNPDSERARKIAVMAAAARGESDVPCTIETVLPHLHAVQDVRDFGAPTPFPAQALQRDEERVWKPGLDDDLRTCYDQMALPAELGFEWTR